MSDEVFFPARPETRPMIYAYREDNPNYAGMLKVGFASRVCQLSSRCSLLLCLLIRPFV